MKPDAALSQLVERLLHAYGRDLISVVLYGSAASGDFQPGRSDLNVLCVLRDAGVASLEKAEQTAHWWRALGNPAPLLLAEGELARSSDAFPIEFLDIREHHRLLHGEDPFTGVEVDAVFHRVQVEHELRAKLIALRQRYLGIYRDKAAVVKLLVDSLSSFAALFRHALVITGENPPAGKGEILQAAARRFGFDPAPFLAVLALREGTRKRPQGDARALFEGYYNGVSRVCQQVDELVHGAGAGPGVPWVRPA